MWKCRYCLQWAGGSSRCTCAARVSSTFSWIFAYNASSDILASSRPGHLLSLDTGHEEAGVAQGENIQWCPGSSSEQVVKDYLFKKSNPSAHLLSGIIVVSTESLTTEPVPARAPCPRPPRPRYPPSCSSSRGRGRGRGPGAGGRCSCCCRATRARPRLTTSWCPPRPPP